MSARKLVTVSAALCAVFMGAGHASAGSVNVPNVPKVSVPKVYAPKAQKPNVPGSDLDIGGVGPRVGGNSSNAAGVSGRARYYSPAPHTSNAACGRYPYPPCKR